MLCLALQVSCYSSAITVSPPLTFWLSSTFMFVSIGKNKSTLDPNLIKTYESNLSSKDEL